MSDNEDMMKPHSFITIFAFAALVQLSASGASAPTGQQQGGQKPMQHDMSKMDMAGMMTEPHHALAMSYMQNIGTFAKALNTLANASTPLDVKFAREAVDEIDRSYERMETHHDAHMKSMTDEMRSHMAAMMKDMATHKSTLQASVRALKADVRASQLDAKQVAAHSADILKLLDDMKKMHEGQTGK